MNINTLIPIDLSGNIICDEHQQLISVKTPLTASKKILFGVNQQRSLTEYPSVIDLSSQLTQPEDQRRTSACVAFAATTFVETLLWKLTGEHCEFSRDEIFNIFFDTYGANIKFQNLAISKPITAEQRKLYRGEDGLWNNIPESFNGIYSLLMNNSVFIDVLNRMYPYYWIVNYNKFSVRMNHYPHKYSAICEKARNYIFNRIYVNAADELITPTTIRNKMLNGKVPVDSTIAGQSSSHAVVAGQAYKDKICFDSSYDESNIDFITLSCSNDTWTKCSDSRFNKCSAIRYYQQHSEFTPCISSRIKLGVQQIKNNVLCNDIGGSLYGYENGDVIQYTKVNSSDPNYTQIFISAIPDQDSYFYCWSIAHLNNIKTPQTSYNNPLEYIISNVSGELSVTAVFTDTPNDYVLFKLNISESVRENRCLIKVDGNPITVYDPETGALYEYSKSFKCGTKHTIRIEMTSDDYRFIEWNDGVTDMVREITMNDNYYLTPVIHNKARTTIRYKCVDSVYYHHITPADETKPVVINFGD